MEKPFRILPLQQYYPERVQELMTAVVDYWRGIRPRPAQDLDYVNQVIALNVPDLPALNRYLSQLADRPLQLRAVVALFGLDDGQRKTQKQVSERFGCTPSAITPHYRIGMARLRHPRRLRMPD